MRREEGAIAKAIVKPTIPPPTTTTSKSRVGGSVGVFVYPFSPGMVRGGMVDKDMGEFNEWQLNRVEIRMLIELLPF
jgi:hypothetical protein